MNKVFLIALVSSLCISASAQSLTATNLTVESGSSANVEISMLGVGSYVSSGFIINLPEGFTIANSSSAVSNHNVQTYLLSNNKMKVAVYSLDNDAFGDNESGMLNLTINAGANKGSYQGTISNIEFASANASLTQKPNVTFNIEVSGPETINGDANGDGKVTVADYTAIAHYIMGNVPANFNEAAADVNGDGKINVADYTAVAHLLLYGTIVKPHSSKSQK